MMMKQCRERNNEFKGHPDEARTSCLELNLEWQTSILWFADKSLLPSCFYRVILFGKLVNCGRVGARITRVNKGSPVRHKETRHDEIPQFSHDSISSGKLTTILSTKRLETTFHASLPNMNMYMSVTRLLSLSRRRQEIKERKNLFFHLRMFKWKTLWAVGIKQDEILTTSRRKDNDFREIHGTLIGISLVC